MKSIRHPVSPTCSGVDPRGPKAKSPALVSIVVDLEGRASLENPERLVLAVMDMERRRVRRLGDRDDAEETSRVLGGGLLAGAATGLRRLLLGRCGRRRLPRRARRRRRPRPSCACGASAWGPPPRPVRPRRRLLAVAGRSATASSAFLRVRRCGLGASSSAGAASAATPSSGSPGARAGSTDPRRTRRRLPAAGSSAVGSPAGGGVALSGSSAVDGGGLHALGVGGEVVARRLGQRRERAAPAARAARRGTVLGHVGRLDELGDLDLEVLRGEDHVLVGDGLVERGQLGGRDLLGPHLELEYLGAVGARGLLAVRLGLRRGLARLAAAAPATPAALAQLDDGALRRQRRPVARKPRRSRRGRRGRCRCADPSRAGRRPWPARPRGTSRRWRSRSRLRRTPGRGDASSPSPRWPAGARRPRAGGPSSSRAGA